ncbi:MAG: carboxypeptidase regulatory-like domain-containing protein, partial [Thermoanaerobaculales bacterium]
MKRFAIVALFAAMVSLRGFAQMPTGTLSGRASDGKEALPGVNVTVTSPNLQGARTAVTGSSGDYIFAFLPPGEYQVKFELEGFETIETTVRINAAQTQRLDATMPQAKVKEEVKVTGSIETISATQQASTTYEASVVGKLPLARDMNAYINLSPGVSPNGPGGATVIGGGNSFDNLYMVNGVVVNENIRGQLLNLYIEDAIQESTTT